MRKQHYRILAICGVILAVLVGVYFIGSGFNIREENGFRVLLDKPMVLHADGEYCGDVTRVEFRCLEKRLWLLHEKEGD